MSLAKKQHFISRYVATVGTLRDAWFDLAELKAEWDALGYSGGITVNDIDQEHLTPTILADGINTYNALKAVLDAGHMTNLLKITG